MEDYENWKELEKAINLAIACMLRERQTLGWQDDADDKIKLLDSAVRELQRLIESSK